MTGGGSVAARGPPAVWYRPMTLLFLLLGCPAPGPREEGDSGTDSPTDSVPTDSLPTDSTPADSTPGDDTGTTISTPWDELDEDGDGYTWRTGDCRDHDPGAHRGAPDTAGDGRDDNCDGIDSDRWVLAEVAALRWWTGDLYPGGVGNRAGRAVTFVPGALATGAAILVSGPSEENPEGPRSPWPATWLLDPLANPSGPLTDHARALWVESQDDTYYGEAVVGPAGDIDGDGFTDGVLGAHGAEAGAGAASVLSPAAPGRYDPDEAVVTLVGERGDELGGAVCGDVDLDGDGRPDLLTNEYNDGMVFLGLTPGVYATADADARITAFPFCSGAPATDLDGDGIPEVFVREDVAIYAAAGPALARGVVSPIFTYTRTEDGEDAASTGDVNGDGAIDVAFGSLDYESAGDRSGRGVFFLGPLQGARDFAEPDAWLDAESSWIGVSAALTITSDLDQDGDTEILVGAPGIYADVTGAVVVFRDLWTGGRTTADADLVLDGHGLFGNFGLALSGGADADADGVDDLVVGAPGDDDNTGAAWLFSGADLDARMRAFGR